MLKAENLSVNRGGYQLFKGLEMDIQPGQVVGLSGPNGAGKSSLILAILDLIPYDGSFEKNYESKSLGVVWQDRGLPLNVSPKRWFDYLSTLYTTPLDHALLERFDFRLAEKPIRSYSGGEQQKIAIISAFFHNPKMLVLDEPTVGLDEMARNSFYELSRESSNKGSAILVTSHLQQDISAITDTNFQLGKSDRKNPEVN